MSTTVLTGIVCNNTCFGFKEGDNTPDYLGLFGPAFGQLIGPFELDISATGYSLTVNVHSLPFSFNDPHLSISFNSPLLASFSPGAFEFIATGNNAFGIAVAETEFFCPTVEPFTPGVPEPATWALMLIGFGLVAGVARLRKRPKDKLACGRSLHLAC